MTSHSLSPTPPPASRLSPLLNRDLLAELLADKRSPNTRHAYQKDLRDFFRSVANSDPTPELVAQFLSLERFDAVALVLHYKAQLLERGLKEATINRRLSALKALVNYARRVGKCAYTLEDLKGEKVQKYRDTTGISRQLYRQVLSQPDRSTLKGKRDYALLRLLWDNALRRGEVSSANLGDFDPEARRLKIRGKGKGTQVEAIALSQVTVAALLEWLQARRELAPMAPLFCALDRAHYGQRLTGSGIAWLVQGYCRVAGLQKPISPHRIRHSSITAALEATDGNVRKVQKLSRHANLDTLMIYDDNRQKDQLEISDLLAEMV